LTAEALKMKLELSRLASQHGVMSTPITILPSGPVDYPVILGGYASTTDIDGERMKFRRLAFNNPFFWLSGYKLPPLLYKHDPEQIAGEIESLTYDKAGNLKIRAHVTHEKAARCNAFSVRAKILEYELIDTDSKNFHALVAMRN
jgi:hypothetical protein